MTSSPLDESARLHLPYLTAGQMQKHLTLNEALTRLDLLVQCQVLSRTVSAQPEAPADGAVHIVPEGAVGEAWSLFDSGDLARFEGGGWTRTAPIDGMVAHVADEGRLLVRHDGAWGPLSSQLGELQSLQRLGVMTEADDDNPVALRVAKVLLTAPEAGPGDMRLTLNRGADGVGSLLFQTDFQGRAEMGLMEGESLAVKVSADGAAWTTALSIDPADGQVAFVRGAVRRETTIFDAAGDYPVPAWARMLEITCIGGGGGGGAGMSGPAGSNRFGGGGGGAGARIDAVRPTTIASSLTVVVGAGGAGSAAVTAANGGAGGQGGASEVRIGAFAVLGAEGGYGGQGGTGTAGAGGQGGLGDARGNGGGASTTGAWGFPGVHDAAPRGPDGGGGGGGGGAVNSANTVRGGGAGAAGFVIGGSAGSTAATASSGAGIAGASGTSASGHSLYGGVGGGGAGGGGHANSAAGSGGAGGFPGGGGGGGGAARDTAASGAGGAGGAGQVRITAVG